MFYQCLENFPNLSLNVFGARNLPLCFVKGSHLSLSQNSKIVAPFLVFVASLNRSRFCDNNHNQYPRPELVVCFRHRQI